MPSPRRHAVLDALPQPALLVVVVVVVMLVAPSAAQPSPSRDKDNGGDGGGGGGAGPGGVAPPTTSFSAPMVVLLVAVIAGFLFIGFFSVYIRRCGRSGSSSGGAGIPAAALLALSRQEQRNQQQRGLDPAVVASFPTMRYSEARELRVGGKDAALECAVCLSEFEDDEELRFLSRCSHAFHPDCIGEWLAGHVTCPVCRCSLDPDQEVAAAEANSSVAEAAAEQQPDQVVIDVNRDGATEDGNDEEVRRREAMELERIGSQRRALRSQSGRRPQPPPPLVPRAHSTGHSLAACLDGDLERFTLRLPEHVRRGMVAAGEESLRRTTGARGEARAASRSARLGRSDRWPSFIARTFSSRVPFRAAASRRAPDAEPAHGSAPPPAPPRTKRCDSKAPAITADGSATPPKGSVRFDCLGGAVSGARIGDIETEDDDDEKPIARQV